MYNPFINYRISDGWAEHLKRGSLGGTDYPMAVGTPLRAAAAGTVYVTKNGGSGGYIASLHTIYGVIQYLHCSRFAVANGTKVAEGAIIAYSGGAKGAPGAGLSTGPHLHIYILINGIRHDFPAFVIGEEDMTFTDADRYAVAEIKQLLIATAEKDGWDGVYRALEKISKALNLGIQLPTAEQIAGALKTDLITAIKSIDIEALDAEDFAAIAQAVNDEEDRRNRARLN